jgi:DNA replication protein DnaC
VTITEDVRDLLQTIPTSAGSCRICGSTMHGGCCKACELRSEQVAGRLLLRRLTSPLVAAMPRWRGWARGGSPEFTERCSIPDLRKFATKYDPSDGSVVACGPSGCGKTTALVCMMTRALDEAWAAADPKHWVARACWTNAHVLARARREHRLGLGDAPLVDNATHASVLVIDELGFEPQGETLFEVIDSRYCAGLSTIVTTGLHIDPEPSGQSLRQRYGDAFVRRLLENGSRIEGWKRG